jgi:hypothetical protein
MVFWLMTNQLERQHSNQAPPEHKSEVLMLETALSILGSTKAAERCALLSLH